MQGLVRGVVFILLVTCVLSYDCKDEPTFTVDATYVTESGGRGGSNPCFGWVGDPDTDTVEVVDSTTSRCGLPGGTTHPFTVPRGAGLYGGERLILSFSSAGGSAQILRQSNSEIIDLGSGWPIDHCFQKYEGFFCKGTSGECKLRLVIGPPSYIAAIVGGVIGALCCCCCVGGIMFFRRSRMRRREQVNFTIKAAQPNPVTTVAIQQPAMVMAMAVPMQPVQQHAMAMAMPMQPLAVHQQPMQGYNPNMAMPMQQPMGPVADNAPAPAYASYAAPTAALGALPTYGAATAPAYAAPDAPAPKYL